MSFEGACSCSWYKIIVGRGAVTVRRGKAKAARHTHHREWAQKQRGAAQIGNVGPRLHVALWTCVVAACPGLNNCREIQRDLLQAAATSVSGRRVQK